MPTTATTARRHVCARTRRNGGNERVSRNWRLATRRSRRRPMPYPLPSGGLGGGRGNFTLVSLVLTGNTRFLLCVVPDESKERSHENCNCDPRRSFPSGHSGDG